MRIKTVLKRNRKGFEGNAVCRDLKWIAGVIQCRWIWREQDIIWEF